MLIRWHFPLALSIRGASLKALHLSTEFQHKGLSVKVEVSGDKPSSYEIPDKGEIFFSTARAINFLIQDADAGYTQEAEYPRLLRLMVPIMNRVLRSVRNSGVVSSAREINPPDSKASRLFRSWAVEISDDGINWSRLMKEDKFQEFMMVLFPENMAELDSSLFSSIEEAIQDDISPPPEQELVVNCFEYLDDRNYRMAVVESVMCLDIVTSQYLNSYLATYKSIPASRIKKFLQPQLGLSARVAGLLDLCLNEEDRKKIDFDKILKTISWRNGIIHESGHLPSDLREDTITENVLRVLGLVFLLSQERDQAISWPQMRGIGKEVSERTGSPVPHIWIRGRHRVIMELLYFTV